MLEEQRMELKMIRSLFQNSDYVDDRDTYWCVDGFISKAKFRTLIQTSNVKYLNNAIEWYNRSRLEKYGDNGVKTFFMVDIDDFEAYKQSVKDKDIKYADGTSSGLKESELPKVDFNKLVSKSSIESI